MIVGVVLAGGMSKRYGSPKALAPTPEGPALKVIANRLREVASTVAVSLSRRVPPAVTSLARAVGDMVVFDEETRLPCKGPLLGILSVWRVTGAEKILYVNVDVPNIRPPTLRKLLSINWGHSVTLLGDGRTIHSLGYVQSRALRIGLSSCRLNVRARLFDLYRNPASTLVPWPLIVDNPLEVANINVPGKPSLPGRPVITHTTLMRDPYFLWGLVGRRDPSKMILLEARAFWRHGLWRERRKLLRMIRGKYSVGHAHITY